MLQKPEKLLKPWHMGTHPRVLSKGFSMNTNMRGFVVFKNLCVLIFWTKVTSALENLILDVLILVASQSYLFRKQQLKNTIPLEYMALQYITVVRGNSTA